MLNLYDIVICKNKMQPKCIHQPKKHHMDKNVYIQTHRLKPEHMKNKKKEGFIQCICACSLTYYPVTKQNHTINQHSFK